MEVTVVPLQVGSGVAYPAKITYKADADAGAQQVPCSQPLFRAPSCSSVTPPVCLTVPCMLPAALLSCMPLSVDSMHETLCVTSDS